MRRFTAKLLRIGIVLGVVAVLIQVLRLRFGGMMERCFEEMPDDFPPRRMFENLAAIREQNERIIELLSQRMSSEEVAESAKSA